MCSWKHEEKGSQMRFPLALLSLFSIHGLLWSLPVNKDLGLILPASPALQTASPLSCSNPTLETHTEAINIPGLTSKREVGRIEA